MARSFEALFAKGDGIEVFFCSFSHLIPSKNTKKRPQIQPYYVQFLSKSCP
jgi:hypothetical protein